jgi:HSP20 family protein
MSIITWDPLRELTQFRRQVSDFFARDTNGSTSGVAEWSPTFDVSETDEDITISVELSGVDEKDLTVKHMGSQLSISGKRQFDIVKRHHDGSRREKYSSTFDRSFLLSENVEANNITANFSKGILTVTLPKKPQVKPRTIAITQNPAMTD